MLVSYPLLAARQSLNEAIATSGVSEIGNDPMAAKLAPTVAWRTPPRATNPYLTPTPVCPECGCQVIRASACLMCPGCGWGRCG